MEFLFEELANWRFYLLGAYPKAALSGLSINIILAILSITAGFFIGAIFGLGRLSRRRYIRYPCIVYIDIVRSTPLILILFWSCFLLPVLGFKPPLFWSSVVSLSIYSSAYQAEIVRAGILSIPSGQMEAALSTGMSRLQSQMLVLLPQAFIKMIPTFLSFANHLFKATSLVFTVGIVELTHTGVIVSRLTPERLYATYFTVALGFWVICYSLSYASQKLEKRFGILDYESYKPEISREDLALIPMPRAVKKMFVTN